MKHLGFDLIKPQHVRGSLNVLEMTVKSHSNHTCKEKRRIDTLAHASLRGIEKKEKGNQDDLSWTCLIIDRVNQGWPRDCSRATV